MQSKIQIHTLHRIHSTFDLCEVFNQQMEAFDEREPKEEKNLKLIVDFESTDIQPIKKQIEIGNIEYKRIKKKVVKEVDLTKKSQKTDSLF